MGHNVHSHSWNTVIQSIAMETAAKINASKLNSVSTWMSTADD